MLSPVRILGATAAAIVLAGGGFIVGRLTAPKAEASASQCTEPRSIYRESIDKIDLDADELTDVMRSDARMAANTILQNPSCFNASDRASAQTILDSVNDGVQRNAVDGLREDMEQCVEDATDEYSWSSC